ncbi:nucleoside phosphatase, putative [Leishmania donovani]|uniref:Nucleoside phosphatase, putative n=1 Tax=Leishmania donovani TaxID=5661 RepID=E9BA63_LEIDO|nr:nucleoside phosphatase, putative [Leishmania donovani]CBZ32136.1 nucleoside phosphatase, putative [Leishmania donovani]
MSRVFVAFFAAVLFVVFLTAYDVGVGTANPLQSRHMQLTQNAVKKSEANLVNCREVNADLKSGGGVNAAQAIAEMRRQREELMNIVALERERVVSARSLLQVCEDELASDLSVLFGVADHNFTARIRSLEEKRKHLEGLHSMLNTTPFGAVELRRSSEIRALQAALLHEMRASKKKAENGVANGEACTKTSDKYSVVFDIGSTGNRVHVYKYRVAPATHTAAAAGSELSDIDLVEELFELNHKALSELDNPVQDAPEALWELFMKAKYFVPAELHACTAVEFKATAGLRMLGMEKATEILDGIRARYRNETFWLRGNAPVRILDACEEGPMAWLTVNYLLGVFSRGTKATASTVAVIDLGGGSTQIVFEPGESAFHGMRTDLRYSATLGSRSVSAYQHSYEGYGLHAATKELLFHIQGKSQEKPGGGTTTSTATTTTTTTPANSGDKALPVWNVLGNLGADGSSERDGIVTKRAPPMPPPPLPDAEAVEAFPCFAVGYEDPLGVKNIKKNNAGEPAMPPNFQACANLFRDRLLKPVGLTCEAANCGIAGVMQPPLTNFTGEIYVFSFIFDLLALANSSLVPAGAAVSREKFEVKLPDLATIAEGHCAAFSLTRIAEATAKEGLGSLKPEYECMYYSYVYALLRYGYEVPEDRVLHVVKKIRGYETAWSLGASLLSLT